MELNNPGGFRSRRSYPNLHHVSLAPLTPRFPIDDDIEPTDYFSPRDTLEPTTSGSKTPPRTSYFSSVSVPSTPPILSHSRSTSRTRHHHRSKSSSRATTFSDLNLQSHSRELSLPIHHQSQHQHKKTSSSPHIRRQQSESAHSHAHAQPHTTKSDAEWMLRAGIALASSTREEKGQSWLSKRESSTSLVSEIPIDNETAPHHRHHWRTKSGSSRKSRPGSGASTPGGMTLSRRSSRSRGTSRRGSRAGLTMTTLPLTTTTTTTTASTSSMVAVGATGPVAQGLEADFVDERIRAEMASLQRRDGDGDGDRDDYYGDGVEEDEEYWDGEEYGDDESEYDYSTDETPDEFDEADLQRLTQPLAGSSLEQDEVHDNLSMASAELDRYSDIDSVSLAEGEPVVVEKPGEEGGWEDASWLFRVVKRAII
ncbi:hypothetical protein N7481_001116 [Penicillium waksmanii]|uniref:uncharacterized protein n=1 Tax=Penicillium waksmanii TaxID=69791 RepID=UPI002548D09D|nr:uncharacterized protein N7481_001116 [Penicillium waksmanii]KAJ6000707.1 hypothetical protein N7481_001116 [Penicillium waksmanii]